MIRKLNKNLGELEHQKNQSGIVHGPKSKILNQISKIESRISELKSEKNDIYNRIENEQELEEQERLEAGSTTSLLKMKKEKGKKMIADSDASFDNNENDQDYHSSDDKKSDYSDTSDRFKEDGTGISFKTTASDLNDPDRYIDDGDESFYQARLESWCIERMRKRKAYLKEHRELKEPIIGNYDSNDRSNDDDGNWHNEPRKPCVFLKDHELHGGLMIPGDIFVHLFDYQKTCVKWLWELYCQKVGGVLGDEVIAAFPIYVFYL